MHWIFKQVIPQETLQYLQEYTLEVKALIEQHAGQAKANGSGTYWKGLDMASQLPLATQAQNERLYGVMTSDWMYSLVKQYLDKPYLFNDQIVVKMPQEEFNFQPHRDNQFGPLPDDTTLSTFNFMLILDDFTPQNGAIQVMESNTWYTLYPKAGDILMIEGNTLHASGPNRSDQPRRVYLCHYTDRPLGEGFQQGYYSTPFTR